MKYANRTRRPVPRPGGSLGPGGAWLLALFTVGLVLRAENPADYRREIEPILKEFCYDCHGDGASKGKVTLDEFKTDGALLGDHELC